MEKPVLFNTEMVQAILKGRKTSTRRIVKYDFKTVYTAACASGKWFETYGENLPDNLIEWYVKEKAKQPYIIGDILWVRETWCKLYDLDNNDQIIEKTGKYYYRADGYNPTPYNCFPDGDGFYGDRNCPRWKPSIHMPRKAARIFLKITNVRTERIHEINDEGAKAEGANVGVGWEEKMKESAIERFRKLWDSIYKNWNDNPWVWVIEFERVRGEKNE